MKNLFITFLVVATLVGCATKDKNNNASSEKDSITTSTTTPVDNSTPGPATADPASVTTLEWIDPVVKDLGTLKQNKEIEITYRFKNTGDRPLVIETVTAQCGCTIPEKPQQPFAPGEEGVIKAKFNGVGSGTISKEVYVVANTTPKNHTLTFKGDIK